MLLGALVVGILVSLFQALQINEQTLSFIPKIIVIEKLVIFAPWMSDTLINFTRELIINIPNSIRGDVLNLTVTDINSLIAFGWFCDGGIVFQLPLFDQVGIPAILKILFITLSWCFFHLLSLTLYKIYISLGGIIFGYYLLST